MFSVKNFACLLLLFASLSIARAAGLDLTPLPLSPETAWKVAPADGDRVTLTAHQGVLKIDYEVAINRPRLVGHVTHQEGGFTLRLNKPLSLTKEQARIYFEARTPETPEGLVALRPLIEDAKGERLSYEPLAERSFVKVPQGGWTLWRTHLFNLTEAGGAAQSIYDAEGGDQNSWPDGELRLIGFQVRIYANKGRKTEGKRAGALLIGEVATGGVALADAPFAYADAILKDKGAHRLAFQVSAAFQGIPVEENTSSVTFDPADESLRKQKIFPPLRALHNSWLRYRATGPAGSVASEGDFRWELNKAPGGEAALPGVDQAKAPVIGLVRINPAHTKNPSEVSGIYKSEDPFRVVFRVFSPKGSEAKNPRLEWKLTTYSYDTELAKGEVPVKTGGNYADIAVDLPRDEGRDAYKIHYVLRDADNRTLDAGQQVLGITHPKVLPLTTRTGTMRDRDDIKSRPYFRTTFTKPWGKIKSEKQERENFITMLRESMQLAQSLTYMIDLADLEILPGVYDFRQVDTAMDIAADYGCGITIRLAHAEQSAPYRWQPYTTPRNFDGAPLVGHGYYGSYAIADPEYVDSWYRAFRAVHDRYTQHPAFEGYYIMQAGGEWAVPDQPWEGYIADYSWAAARSFRDYLRETLGLDLPALNKRWSTAYRSWDEVLPPQPTLSAGSAPDIRPSWLDFQRCKLNWKDGWFVNLSRQIRSYDQRRVVIAYGGREKAKELAGLIDYFHNGGNHNLEGEDTLVDAWEKDRIGWITEPHQPFQWAAYGDPAERGWILDWSVYVMTAQAGAGGANLHVYYMPNPTLSLAAHYGNLSGLDRFEMFKPVLRELHDMKLVRTPKQVAVIQDIDTLLAKHRTIFTARLVDLRRWFDLLKRDAVDFEYHRPENEHAYKLLVLNPLDEILSRTSIETAARMARNGAWVVMSARTGHYTSDGSSDEYPLLRALGIDAPKGRFETNVKGVAAPFIAGRELAAGKQAIPFYSQADLRAELQDPAIGADFFRWPYRWIPQTDYFGYFPNNQNVGGETLARFPDGGTAVSLHTVGKGRVLVFWGTPDVKEQSTQGLMAGIAKLAGVTSPRLGSPIPLMIEGRNDELKRRYALLYQETAGTHVQKLPSLPDGEWFVDDMVAGSRLGLVNGKTARETGVPFTFTSETSPLKVLRFIPKKEMKARWTDKYDTLAP